MMGSGMLHPNVLKNCGLDPKKVQGFAFGGGLDRIAMIKWGFPMSGFLSGGFATESDLTGMNPVRDRSVCILYNMKIISVENLIKSNITTEI